MDDATIQRLEDSFNLVAPRAEQLVDRFYERLFSEHPEVRPMFPDDMKEQKQKLLASLKLVVANLRDTGALVPPLQDMGQRHVKYGAEPAHYRVVRDTLLISMAGVAGQAWNDQLSRDWAGAIDLVARVMLDGAGQRAAA